MTLPGIYKVDAILIIILFHVWLEQRGTYMWKETVIHSYFYHQIKVRFQGCYLYWENKK